MSELVTAIDATFGQELLEQSQRCVAAEFAVATVLENKDKAEELIAAKVPDPRYQRKSEILVRKLQKKPYSSKSDRQLIGAWLMDCGLPHLSRAPRYFDNQQTRWQFEVDDMRWEQETAATNIRQQLSDYGVASLALLDKNWDDPRLGVPEFFRVLKNGTEQELQRRLGWSEWIIHHTQDDQLLNIVQWGAARVAEESSDPEFIAQTVRVKQQYGQALNAACADGLLTEERMHEVSQKLNELRITTFNPLSKGAATGDDRVIGGMAHEKHVELRLPTLDAYIFHEISHSVFGGVKGLFNEGVTDKITDYLYKAATGESGTSGQYDAEMRMADDFCELIGMDEGELLRIAMGPSALSNLIAMCDATQKATGFDLFMMLEQNYDESRKLATEYGMETALVGCREMSEDLLRVTKKVFAPLLQTTSTPTAKEVVAQIAQCSREYALPREQYALRTLYCFIIKTHIEQNEI